MSKFLRFLIPIGVFLALFACTKLPGTPDPDEVPDEEIIWDINQVYWSSFLSKEREPFPQREIWSGIKALPFTLWGLEHTNGRIPSNKHYPPDFPWTIEGKISDGIMEFSFPNEIFTLDSYYENSFTDNIRIAQIELRSDNEYLNPVFVLQKWNDDLFGQILIYYSEEDFSKLNNNGSSIELKRGWNFVEVLGDWIFNAKVGRISQSIDNFLLDGYRWEAVFLAGASPNL